MAGQRAGELVGAERLEEARGRQVARLAVAPGERAVGDLADQRLDEGVLAALGRARVDVVDAGARAGRGPRSRGSSSASVRPDDRGQRRRA